MGCTGRYAEAADFAGFWCMATVLKGTHTGADGAAILTDAGADFVNQGIKAGMFLRNATDGSKARITSVTATTISGTLAGGTDNDWDTGDNYEAVLLTYGEATTVEDFLDIAAADIHAALAASGACDCSPAAWAGTYLKKLNVIEAAVIHNCPCGSASNRWTDKMKVEWLRWIQKQLQMLANGELEICAGATGKDFPALGAAEINYGPFSEQEIVWNEILREQG